MFAWTPACAGVTLSYYLFDRALLKLTKKGTNFITTSFYAKTYGKKHEVIKLASAAVWILNFDI